MVLVVFITRRIERACVRKYATDHFFIPVSKDRGSDSHRCARCFL